MFQNLPPGVVAAHATGRRQGNVTASGGGRGAGGGSNGGRRGSGGGFGGGRRQPSAGRGHSNVHMDKVRVTRAMKN